MRKKYLIVLAIENGKPDLAEVMGSTPNQSTSSNLVNGSGDNTG